MIKKILKKTLLYSSVLIVLLVIFYFLFTTFYPSFGGDVSEERQLNYTSSQQFKTGQFHNTRDVPKKMSFSDLMGIAYKFFTTSTPNGRPKANLAVNHIDSIEIANYVGEARLVWFGHSSFLFQLDGKNILIDPMFGMVAAPHPWLGANRFNKEMSISITQLPIIDAVIFSHDHYDHLDYETVLQLRDKTNHFYVPLGVGVHLEEWEIGSDKITELDWWEEVKFESLTFICTPSQHFSGRKLSNNQSTLWASWIIQSSDANIFFSGDSGYSPHFKEIGEKYGPFDIALMECGQYNENWPDVHMLPEETAQAGLEVKADKIMAIHWAGFQLAMHSWTEPITRLRTKAAELNIPVITPEIGQLFNVKDSTNNYEIWWEGL
ncbi:MBL fold metallo-hydrolase [Crocinitomix catalasitica]|uniref:MBL fold metallo-hydrolase n=1 Tax=Crocinitomix catalasitica TaxID=184607 RepID=UPI0004823598|nr:MBL fold metallo-hydrolase [Crocinitomix catalasitica]